MAKQFVSYLLTYRFIFPIPHWDHNRYKSMTGDRISKMLKYVYIGAYSIHAYMYNGFIYMNLCSCCDHIFVGHTNCSLRIYIIYLNVVYSRRPQQDSHGTPCIGYAIPTKIIRRGVSRVVTSCSCGAWCPGSTMCPLFIGPMFGKSILNDLCCKLKRFANNFLYHYVNISW